MKFTLVSKDYKTEQYECIINENIKAIVRMLYHTTRKWWSCGIYFINNKTHHSTPYIDGEDNIETRKEARKLAIKLMKIAKPDGYKKLGSFYKKEMEE